VGQLRHSLQLQYIWGRESEVPKLATKFCVGVRNKRVYSSLRRVRTACW